MDSDLFVDGESDGNGNKRKPVKEKQMQEVNVFAPSYVFLQSRSVYLLGHHGNQCPSAF